MNRKTSTAAISFPYLPQNPNRAMLQMILRDLSEEKPWFLLRLLLCVAPSAERGASMSCMCPVMDVFSASPIRSDM